jgi:alpha-galactosidase
MKWPSPGGWARYFFVLAIALAVCASAIAQKAADLAATPPMGWNSWNRFACNVDEKLIRATADAMVASGMKDAGYVYVNIDDCWHGSRDGDGFIRPDQERFPSGMKALADAVHARGLKLGLYSDAGNTTCGGRPGSRGHEYQDALTYARWGIDYLKYDWCASDGLNARGAYTTMRDALAAAGRPIVLSICEWGDNQPWTWGKDVGHLWRTTGDIHPCWDCEIDHGGWSSWGVLRVLDKQKGLRAHAGPGHWNDPDMLEVGNGMTVAEDRAHFSLWAMLAAPLLAGNDLREMSDDTRRILTNREVIAIDQDPLGIQGFRWRAEGDIEIWARPLAAGAWAVCILNRGETARPVELSWRDEPIADDHSGRRTDFAAMEYLVRDVWSGRDIGSTSAGLAALVPGHDVLMVRLSPTGPEAAK